MSIRTALVILVLLLTSSLCQAAWLDNNWSYRNPVSISNSTGIELTNYQVQITLDSSFSFSKARSDGSDIRVTNVDGATVLPFWVESWSVPLKKASIWVKVPSIPAVGTTLLFIMATQTLLLYPVGLIPLTCIKDLRVSAQVLRPCRAPSTPVNGLVLHPTRCCNLVPQEHGMIRGPLLPVSFGTAQ